MQYDFKKFKDKFEVIVPKSNFWKLDINDISYYISSCDRASKKEVAKWWLKRANIKNIKVNKIDIRKCDPFKTDWIIMPTIKDDTRREG